MFYLEKGNYVREGHLFVCKKGQLFVYKEGHLAYIDFEGLGFGLSSYVSPTYTYVIS
jgi:hypothetical protein